MGYLGKREIIKPHDTCNLYTLLSFIPNYNQLQARFKDKNDTYVKFITLWLYEGLAMPPKPRPHIVLADALWNIRTVIETPVLALHERIAFGAHMAHNWFEINDNDYVFDYEPSPVKMRK